MKDQFFSYLDNIQQLKKANLDRRATKKAHATMFKNRFQPTYLEQIFFAVLRAE